MGWKHPWGFVPPSARRSFTSDVDEELGRVATELGIGQTLIAAGGVVDSPVDREPGSLAELSSALDDLERDIHPREEGASATSAFRRARCPSGATRHGGVRPTDPDLLLRRRSPPNGVRRQGRGVRPARAPPRGRLPCRPPVRSARRGGVDQLGLRAVQRAVEALRRLVPVSVRDQVQQLTGTWWDEGAHPASVVGCSPSDQPRRMPPRSWTS